MRLVLLLCCLAACAAPPPPLPPAPPASVAAADFPGSGGVLTGIDEPSDDRGWAAGDALLLGLQLRRGERVQRWLMRLVVLAGRLPVQRADIHMDDGRDYRGIEFDRNSYVTLSYSGTEDGEPFEYREQSLALPVEVSVFDEQGALLGRSQVLLAADVLGQGLLDGVDAARAAASEDRSARRQRQGATARAYASMLTLLQVVREDDVLAQYFWQVVDKPGLLSVLLHFGVSATLDVQLTRAVDVWPAADVLPAAATAGRATVPPEPPPALPAGARGVLLPVQIDVNGAPALYVDVLATAARRPLALCGGMVAATARHPDNPSLQFDVQVLAARLGR